MKINYISIYKYAIYLIVFLYLGFINLFVDLNYLSITIGVIITAILFLIYLSQKNKRGLIGKYILPFTCLFFLIFIIDLFRLKNFSLSGYTVTDALIHDRFYFFILLALPLNEIFAYKKSRKQILNFLYISGIAILICRFIVWLFYNKFKIDLAPGYFQVMGYNWARNGMTRLPGSFLDNYIWIGSLYFVFFKKDYKKIFVLLFLFFYALIIYDSRSQIIAMAFILILSVIIIKKSFISKVVTWFLGPILLFLSFNSPFFIKILNTFSITDSDYGGSTLIRLNTFNIYQELWLNNGVWWGYGISNDGNYFSNLSFQMINQSDLGIISSLFQFGIVGFVILLFPLVQGIYLSLRNWKSVYNKLLLLFVIMTFMTSLMSQNMYDPMRSLILPFLLVFNSTIDSINHRKDSNGF